MKKTSLLIVGRKEKIDLPELDLYEIDAKIDTGAYSSSLHCHNLTQEGDKVRFKILDPSHAQYNHKEFVLPIEFEKTVKNSSGESEKRIFIKTTIALFDQHFEISLSLTNRSKMKYPLLLGRKALRHRFIVNAAEENLSYKYKLGVQS